MKLNQEQVLGIIRHSLTFVGGILIMYGIGSETAFSEITGSAVALVGAIWSVFSNKK
jgi:hypothetical protein